jgi:flagellar hook-associated protein 2
MGLRFDPVGGGQFKAAVKAIMDAESQPMKSLEARKAQEETRLKLFQEFKGKFAGVDKALDEISSFKKMRELKVDLGDGQNVLGATVDKNAAQPGSYQIEVKELAERSSVMSNGFSDPDEKSLGIGWITMHRQNGDDAEIFIDEDHASLRGVCDAINAKDLPVRAAVVKDSSQDDNPWKLILTAKSDGKDGHVDFPDFYFLDGDQDFHIDDNREAKNALIKMNGFEIEAEGNDVKDFLPGVNLHLKQAKPGEPFTMNITEDLQKVSGKVKGMVDQLNGILEFITKQNQVDEKSDTRTTFTGDTGLQTVEFRIRNMMHEGLPVGDRDSDKFHRVFMSDLGVEFNKTGQLDFKEDKFNKEMEKNFNDVAEAISGEFGFVFQMKQIMAGYTRSGTGMLAIRESSMRNQIKQIDTQIAQKAEQLERRQQALTDQFSRLEGSLSNMQRQQQYLSATLGGGGGGNLVSQLLGG